jgi:predicted alpha/beta-fold hydrolase
MAFVPCPWLLGPHAQTLWAAVVRRRPPVPVIEESVETDDGDAVRLSWAAAPGAAADAPVLIVCHGLEGDLRSHYIPGLFRAALARGWRAVLLHFRGAAGRPNRLARSYHSGDTGDIARLAALCRRRHPAAPLMAAGFSLGGNALLCWLAETGAACPLSAAAVAGVPFDLARSADALGRGAARLYQAHLVRCLVRSYRAKAHLLDVAPGEWRRMRTFRDVDSRLTAPLNGFASVDDYYARASSGPRIPAIRVPTLITGAADDPFVPADTWPDPATVPPSVVVERHARGGHLGFTAGRVRPRPWLEPRLVGWLADQLAGRTA